MEFENFKEMFVEDVKEKLDEKGIEAKLTTQEVRKINDSYESLTVTPEGSNIGVNLNLEAFFNSTNNGAEYSDVVEKAVDVVQEGIKNQPAIDVSALTDYNQMKDKLIMEIVSKENNKEMLENIPHKEMEDMAVVYRFELASDGDNHATVLATNQLIESMGVTPEQLHKDALENAPEIKPAVIKGMSEVMAEMMGMEHEEMEAMGLLVDDSEEAMYVATTPDKNRGAGVMAYENFMDQAAERAGGDFFILPSSVHEILIVPDNGKMELGDLQDMVREVNRTQVAPEEKLTDSVYHYDSKEKIFELGEKFVDRMSQRDSQEKAAEGNTKKDDIVGYISPVKDDLAEKDSVVGAIESKKEEIAAKAPKEKEASSKNTKSKGGEAI